MCGQSSCEKPINSDEVSSLCVQLKRRRSRAIIALEPTDTPGVFKLIAAKRYQRIGWSHYEQYWAHSREPGVLLWVPADSDQIALASEAAKAKPMTCSR